MIVIAFILIGAVGGGLRAKGKGGNRLDIAQYAAIYGMIFGVFGLFLTIYLARMA